jgi:hypothetical protein
MSQTLKVKENCLRESIQTYMGLELMVILRNPSYKSGHMREKKEVYVSNKISCAD